MSYVTGISGNVISAASAAYAPTNGADVSSIASAYVESGVSSKQDTLTFGYDDSAISSINGSALAGGGGATGDYVEKSATVVAIGTSASAAGSDALAQGYGVSAKSYGLAQGIHTLANSYAFAQGHSNSAWSYSLAQGLSNRASATSFAQGVYNSASSNSFVQGNHLSALYSSVVFGGYNLHGNGNTATGDSAAFAIGDGTASDARHDLMLVTKDGEITMFSSTADTTGTGIMSSIRALSANAGGVDSATVSAIASSYAESAASSKLDESATADFYSTSNPSSFITGVDLSDYATTAYVDSSVSSKLDTTAFNSGDFYTTANPSGFITVVDLSDYATTAYVDSSVSSFVDSAECSAIASSYAESAASGKLDTTAFNSGDFYLTSNPSGFITGVDLADYATTAYVDSSVSGKQDTLTFGYDADKISAINGSALAGGGGGGGSTISTGEFLGYTVVSADNGVSVVGNSGVVSSSVSIPYTDTTWATNTISANSNKSQFRIYNFNRTAGNMTSLPTGNSVRIRVTAATPNQSVYTDDQIHLIVYTGTNSGSPIGNWQVQSANGYKSAMWDKTVTWNSTNQPNMLITAENFNTYSFSTTALYSAVGVGSSVSESSYTADVLAVHPSYVSSVASSYAESAVSAVSGDYYSTSNPSGFITAAPFDSATCSAIASSYAESAVSSVSGNYYTTANESGYALSADVSGTVDLVSSQSANWGGYALALSAGPGVKLEKVGDTLVVSTDGTVINEETIAGTWNGNIVYQMMLSGTGQTPGTSNIALPAELTSTSIARKWIDPSNSYILYGTTSNILPSTWVLGEGRYGSLDIIGVNVTMRSTDNGTTTCSAFFNVKYIKAEA